MIALELTHNAHFAACCSLLHYAGLYMCHTGPGLHALRRSAQAPTLFEGPSIYNDKPSCPRSIHLCSFSTMEPVYSRDECIAAIRDYYTFLTTMFMDSAFIIEPPQDGWPNITTEATQGLGKTDAVIDLLRHLPYIVDKPYSNHPEGLPGGTFIDWKHVIEKLHNGEAHPENELLMSEGTEDQFDGKIPAHCIGLVHGGLLMGNEEPDVILLDTRSGVVYWMDCPAKVRETASPQPSYLVYPLDGEAVGTKEDDTETDEDEDEDEENNSEEEAEDEEDDGDDGDSGSEDEEIRWGECWPIRHFFEMLKNQFRQLNFMAKDANDVIDIWTKDTGYPGPIPEGFTDTIQAIYREHGWPDVARYQKDNCLADIKKELEEKYPEHHLYYFRCLT